MEPNGPFQMQYYDQGHGNSNGFPPNFSQSPSISSPNNSMSNPSTPYGYRPMENGISRYMNESFDGQNYGQHSSQFYQQSGVNPRRNDSNFPMKTQQQMGAQGFPNPMQHPNFGTSRDNFSSGNYNSFMPANMKERLHSEGDMFTSSAQNFSQVRQNPVNSIPRDMFPSQMQMGMMDNSMPQPNQMGAPQTSEFPQPYQQFQNRQDFQRNQFYAQDASGFPNNGIRPEGFSHQFPQSPSPQTPTQGPMEQRPTSMFSRGGQGFPPNPPKRNENSLNPTQPMGDSQRQAAMIAAAAAVRAAAVASNRQGRDFPPTTGYPNTFQYGPRPYMPPQDMVGSPFNPAAGNMPSPLGKDLSAVSPLAHNLPRHGRTSTESPMNQGSMSSRNSSNSLSFSPNVDQSSPGFSTQAKLPSGSPSTIKTASQPEVLASVARPGSGSDHGKFSDPGTGEVPIKREPNLAANCSAFENENDSLDSKIPISSRTDVDEIVDTVSELEKEAEVKIKKEAYVDQKPDSEDLVSEGKPPQEEKGKNLLPAPYNKSSAPPTPLSAISGVSPAPSPLPDDLDLCNASPSWPNTPTSPTAKRLLQSQSPARFDQLSKLYDLSEDEERRNFLDKYLAFMSVNGTPVTKVPVVSKQPLDLYRLFRLVLERGGLQEVLKRKQFREVLKTLNLPSTNSSLAYTVKNQYTKYLLAFENKMKGAFLKQWHCNDDSKPEKSVPTIALNDTLPSAMKDLSQASLMSQSLGNTLPRSSQGPSDHGLRDWQMPVSDTNNQPGFQMGNRLPGQMPFSQNSAAVGSSFNQTRPTYGRTSYANSPDMSSGYPMSSFMRFQRPNPTFQRNPNQPYGSGPSFPGQMQQNPLSPSWPRNFPPRPVTGPPELFPEGLQRSPWMQAQQQIPVSRNQQYVNKDHRMSNKLKGFLSAQKDQDTPWPTNKGPNIPLKPKRSSTPGTTDMLSGPAPQKAGPHANIKRESLIFPPNSIENTKPLLNKRPKLTSKELGPVEAWRIMMSLKSGMLAECTWAIDTLNILLHDDKTIAYFHLPQLPGLLDTLMDHFRRCCIDAFSLLDDAEAAIVIETDKTSDQNKATIGLKRTSKDILNDLWVGVVKNSSTSYTATVASCCVPESDSDIYNVNENTWKEGGADDTAHIQLCFNRKRGYNETRPETEDSQPESRLQSIVDTESKDEAMDKDEVNADENTRNEVNENQDVPKVGAKRTIDFLNREGCVSKSISLVEEIKTNKRKNLNKITDRLLNHMKLDLAKDTDSGPLSIPKKNEDKTPCFVPVNGTDFENGKASDDVENSLENVDKSDEIMLEEKDDAERKHEQLEKSNDNMEKSNCNTEKSKNSTEKLNDSTEKSGDNTEKSISNTKKSIDNTKKSIDNTERSIGNTEKSNDNTKKANDNTKKSNDNTEKSNDNTKKSNHNTEKSNNNSENVDENTDEAQDKTEKDPSEPNSKPHSNLASFESFKAMTILEEDLLKPKIKLDEAVDELCNTLELDLDYTKQYLDTSKEFIGYLKNRLSSENRGKVPCQEAFTPENSPFCSRTEVKEFIVARFVAVSNIFRSLSFVSGNDNDLANHPGLLLLIGRLLLYRHEHPVTDHSEFRLTQEDSEMIPHDTVPKSTSGPCLEGLRAVQENILVILANIAGQIDLSRYSEHIVLPLLDGLLHWVICKSSAALDAMPTAPSKYALSPKRLALETLAKLSITDNNVDLILATPPVNRLKLVFKELVKAIGIRTSIPVREFAVVVLDNLAHGDSIVPLILEQKSCIGSVLLFLEEAERNTSSYVSAGGVVQPGLSAEDVCGTSVNMLRRAADILLCLSRGSEDRSPFLPYVHRLLSLATSQMMDTSVLKILSEIMYELR